MNNVQWRNYLRIIANRENLYGTTIHYAIIENQGHLFNIEGTNSTIIALHDLEVEVLDEETARARISGNDEHERQFDRTMLKTIYRLTLPDGQRLIYVQCCDCHESFITQDSHKSFDQE